MRDNERCQMMSNDKWKIFALPYLLIGVLNGKKTRINTQLVHAGERGAPPQGKPVSTPIYTTATFTYDSMAEVDSGFRRGATGLHLHALRQSHGRGAGRSHARA